MSRRTNTTPGGVERRAEREARQLGTAPRPARARPARPAQVPKRGLPIIGQLPLTAIFAAVGIASIIAILVYAVTQTNNVDTGPPEWLEAQLDEDPSLPGTYVAPHPGADATFDSGSNRNSDDRAHFANGRVIPFCTPEQTAANNFSEPLCYHSNPPTSGPHASSPMPFKVLENPAPKENLVHNMEHSGVVVWYNTQDRSTIDRLASIVNEQLDRRRLVVMSEYSEMEPETIALTGWTRLDKFPASQLDARRVTDFIEEHQRRFNPEGF